MTLLTDIWHSCQGLICTAAVWVAIGTAQWGWEKFKEAKK